MNYLSAIEKRDYSKIDKLNNLTNKETFWDDVRKLTKNVTSDHAIKRWQCLADQRWGELNTSTLRCSECWKKVGELDFTTNVYGDILCDDCWDDYINSDRGKVEYFVAVVKDEEDIRAFDADALGEIAASWKRNKHRTDFSKETIELFEKKATELGLL
jgi:hypothetical protein